MEEIKLKNNPLGIKVYAIGKPEMTENEYSLLVSAFADKMDEIFNTKSGSEIPFEKGLTCLYNKRTPQSHNPNFLALEKEAK